MPFETSSLDSFPLREFLVVGTGVADLSVSLSLSLSLSSSKMASPVFSRLPAGISITSSSSYDDGNDRDRDCPRDDSFLSS